jgi:type I restriction enzyme R subunit
VPEGGDVDDRYDMPEFERKITMPDHIKKLCEHMNKLLHRFGRMEKTMVFCVNMDHALKVTEELNRLNADLNVPDYAVRIVSEEGATGKAMLERFQDTEKAVPVVATTVDLLTTGVDAPSVRNVVFMKPIASIVSFKQIVGRGSRLCQDTDKFWFRVIDYTNASRLFDDWDRPREPGEGGANTEGPYTLHRRRHRHGRRDRPAHRACPRLSPDQPQRGPGPVHRLQRPVLLSKHRQGQGRSRRHRRRP